MPSPNAALVGQATMLSCWRALARTEFGPGRLVTTPHAIAALFPTSPFFNNAILTTATESAGDAAASVADVYAAAGISTWALWVRSDAAAFDGPSDRVDAVGPLDRDATTLAMQLRIGAGLRRDDRVQTVSSAALFRLVADEAAVRTGELGDHTPGDRVTGWALVENGRAVTSAYTHRRGRDLGVYAVGTLTAWRRRGLARALVEHILADAHCTGARTATLQSTPLGLSVYEALGFRATGRYEEWLHTPERSPVRADS